MGTRETLRRLLPDGTRRGTVVRRLTGRPVRAWRKKGRAYGQQFDAVLVRVLGPESCCVDVGAANGRVLARMVELAPNGRHFAVEPIPDAAARLTERFPQVTVFAGALAAERGTSTFHHFEQRPGYSGIRERPTTFDLGPATLLEVPVTTLDALIPDHVDVDLLKIDVEGGHGGVLQGGAQTLRRTAFVAFEHGKRAAAVYGTTADDIWALLHDAGFRLSTMATWLAVRPPLSRAAFVANRGHDFFFLAHR